MVYLGHAQAKHAHDTPLTGLCLQTAMEPARTGQAQPGGYLSQSLPADVHYDLWPYLAPDGRGGITISQAEDFIQLNNRSRSGRPGKR